MQFEIFSIISYQNALSDKNLPRILTLAAVCDIIYGNENYSEVKSCIVVIADKK